MKNMKEPKVKFIIRLRLAVDNLCDLSRPEDHKAEIRGQKQ